MIFFHSFFLWNGYFFETIIHIGLWHQIKFFTHYGIITNLKFDYYVGLDSLNIWLIWLTSLLTFLCIYFLWDNEAKSVFLLQASWIFFLEFSSFQFFCVCDFIWMYIFFELSLLPIFILIIYGGST